MGVALGMTWGNAPFVLEDISPVNGGKPCPCSLDSRVRGNDGSAHGNDGGASRFALPLSIPLF